MYGQLKNIISNTLVYGFGNVLTTLIGVILIPVYTRYLTINELGLINTISTASSVLLYFFNLGFSGAAMHYDAILKSPDEKKKFHGSAWCFLVLVSLVNILVLLCAGPYIWPFVVHNIPYYPYFPLLILIAAANSLQTIPLALLRIRGQSVTFAMLQLISFIFGVTLIIYFVIFKDFGPKGQISATLVNSLLFGFVFLYVTFPHIRICLKWKIVLKYLYFGLPLIPSGLSIWFLSFSSILILQKYRSLEEVAVYSLSLKFLLIIDLLMTAFFTSSLPFFYQSVSTVTGRNDLKRISTYFLYCLIFLCTIIISTTDNIIIIIATKDYIEVAKLLPYLVVGVIFNGLYRLNVQTIYVKDKTKYLALIDGVAAIFCFLISILFIPNHGIYGAAWASTIAYFLRITYCFLFARNVDFIKFEYICILKIVVLAFITYVSVGYIHFGNNLFEFFTKILLIPIFFLIGSYVLGIMNQSEKAYLAKIILFKT